MSDLKKSGIFFILFISFAWINLSGFLGYIIPLLLIIPCIYFLANGLSSIEKNKSIDISSSTTSNQNLNASTKNFISEHNLDKQYRFELKGLKYTKGYELVEQQVIDSYEELRLELEPDNEYDSNAVAVYYNTEKIGYVEKERARGAKKLVNDGFTFCFIHNIKFYHHEKSRKDIIYLDITIPYKMKD